MERAAARGAGGVAPGMELGVEDNNLYCCVQLLLLSIMGCCVGVGVYVEPLFEMCCFHMGLGGRLKLFGQCPYRTNTFQKGASLREVPYKGLHGGSSLWRIAWGMMRVCMGLLLLGKGSNNQNGNLRWYLP